MVSESRDVGPEHSHASRTTESLMWVYCDLIRIEQHWTDQVQNQQRRIAAVLAVNGFLLAFLTAAQFQVTDRQESGWYFYPFYIALILLTIALIFGVLTLFPQLRIGGGGRARWFHSTFLASTPDPLALWLDSQAVWRSFCRSGSSATLDDLLVDLCESVSANANGNLDHCKTQVRRRKWMNWQIAFIMLSLVLLVVSVIGWAAHVL
jgi:uncharacterized membrane protein YidH (DUF202 family)